MDDPADISQQVEMRNSILSEDGRLKYDFMISLKKIAMARIMSSLWMNQSIKQDIMELYRLYKRVSWINFHKIEKVICAKVSQLLLPNSLCQELRYLVSVVRDVILDWIEYHDEHIFSPEESECYAAYFIHNIAWTARAKINYLQTAKNILAISDSGLSDDYKYKLACTYCLEDEISLLSSNLINKCYLSYIMIDKHPMVYFWTAHITGDMTQLNNPRYHSDRNRRYEAMSINELIIQLLIKNNGIIGDKTNNDVPIKFMWNKLSGEEKVRNIALFKNAYNPDFIISLLSNLDYDQQQNFVKECFDAVLSAILNNWWLWGNYFLPTALNILDIMDPPCFWKILRELNRKKEMSSEKNMYDHFKTLFKLLWQEGSTQLKEFIFHDKVIPLDEFVIFQVDWKRDMDVIEVILKDLNAKEKKNIAFGEDGIGRCAYFIEYDKWDLLDLFIKCTLSSEEDINQLKQRLIQDSGRKIAITFLRQRDFHKMDCFMNWAFKSEEEIAIFYQSLNITAPPLTQ